MTDIFEHVYKIGFSCQSPCHAVNANIYHSYQHKARVLALVILNCPCTSLTLWMLCSHSPLYLYAFVNPTWNAQPFPVRPESWAGILTCSAATACLLKKSVDAPEVNENIWFLPDPFTSQPAHMGWQVTRVPRRTRQTGNGVGGLVLPSTQRPRKKRKKTILAQKTIQIDQEWSVIIKTWAFIVIVIAFISDCPVSSQSLMVEGLFANGSFI